MNHEFDINPDLDMSGLKWKDLDIPHSFTLQSVTSLVDVIVPGLDVGDRIGRQIRVRRVHVKGIISYQSIRTSPCIHTMAIVLDRGGPDVTLPTFNDIFGNVAYPMLRQDNCLRFLPLMFKGVDVPSFGDNYCGCTIDEVVNCDIVVCYREGTTAVVSNDVLCVLSYSGGVPNTSVFWCRCRVYYED